MTPTSFLTWRQQLGLNKAQAAKALGIARTTLDDYESGRYPVPPVVALACAALRMGIKPEV